MILDNDANMSDVTHCENQQEQLENDYRVHSKVSKHNQLKHQVSQLNQVNYEIDKENVFLSFILDPF